jgi:hypothetical protein
MREIIISPIRLWQLWMRRRRERDWIEIMVRRRERESRQYMPVSIIVRLARRGK